MAWAGSSESHNSWTNKAVVLSLFLRGISDYIGLVKINDSRSNRIRSVPPARKKRQLASLNLEFDVSSVKDCRIQTGSNWTSAFHSTSRTVSITKTIRDYDPLFNILDERS